MKLHKSSQQRLLWKLKNSKQPIAVFITPTGARIAKPDSDQFMDMLDKHQFLGVYHRPEPAHVLEDLDTIMPRR